MHDGTCAQSYVSLTIILAAAGGEHREPRSRFTVLDPEELGVENPQKYWIFSIC